MRGSTLGFFVGVVLLTGGLTILFGWEIGLGMAGLGLGIACLLGSYALWEEEIADQRKEKENG